MITTSCRKERIMEDWEKTIGRVCWENIKTGDIGHGDWISCGVAQQHVIHNNRIQRGVMRYWFEAKSSS